MCARPMFEALPGTMARRKKKQSEEKKVEGHARRLLRRFLEEAHSRSRRETSRWKRFKLWVWRGWLYALAWAAEATWEKLTGLLVLAAAVLIITFLLPQEKSPEHGLEHTVDVESPDFLPTIMGGTGAATTAGNKIDILTNGSHIYPAMLDAINQAQHSITLEAFIFWDGEVGRKFADALAAKARAGIPVRLLLDSVGSARYKSFEVTRQLEKAGCRIGWYHPIKLLLLNRFDNRTHRELLIVDGRVGFTGGAGIADHWSGDAENPDHWRDTSVRIEGPAVSTLQTAFSLKWLETTEELISGPDYFPAVAPSGTLSVNTVLSEPETRSSPARILYFLSIMSARKSILIANPYFVPDPKAVELLRDARRRGVGVKIMVAGDHNDHAIARRNSSRLYGQLLEAGVEIYEYDRTMMHHKYMVCDGVWSTIGTINFDNLSFALNDEDNVCVYDQNFAAQLTQMFDEDTAACQKIDLAKWRDRGLVTRAVEWFSFLFKRVT
jgi:cardiolipin synthase A/B